MVIGRELEMRQMGRMKKMVGASVLSETGRELEQLKRDRRDEHQKRGNENKREVWEVWHMTAESKEMAGSM
jgi:hypothetical protein